jgi:hypothetical protein
MGLVKWANVGSEIGISTPKGDLSIIIKKILGTKHNRACQIEVHGIQKPENGKLVGITRSQSAEIYEGLLVKVADSASPGHLIKLYMELPKTYRVYNIKG